MNFTASVFLLFFILIEFPSYSQRSGKITYTCTTNFEDNTSHREGSQSTFVLYFSNQESLYVNEDEAVAATAGNDHFKITITGASVYKDFIQKRISGQDFILTKAYIVQEPLFDIKWELTKEHKKIGSYLCQKAISVFRGRTYHAWFTTDIPVSNGPWKLHGLPGLILEAYDTTGVVTFLARSIEQTETSAKVAPPSKGITVTRETFVAEREKKLKQLQQFLKSSTSKSPSAEVTVSIKLSDTLEIGE